MRDTYPNILAKSFIALIVVLFTLLLLGLVALSLGFFPILQQDSLSLWPWRAWFTQPQLWSATLLTMCIALLATAMSVALSMALLALKMTVLPSKKNYFSRTTVSLMTPLLAVPHALLAMAVIIVLSPTGWWMRTVSLVLGRIQPTEYLFAPDPYGLTLLLVLVIKETAFLFLMATAALSITQDQPLLILGRSFGYQRLTGWVKIVFPLIYPRLKLPILAVLIYSASTVELPMLTNSHSAATLSMLILRAANHHDLNQWLVASAGAIYLLGVAIVLMLLWHRLEWLIVRTMRPWLSAGGRGQYWGEWIAQQSIRLVMVLLFTLSLFSILGLIITALSWRWAFPDIWPSMWRWQAIQGTQEWSKLWQSADFTIAIALAATVSLLAIALSVLLLEANAKWRQYIARVMYLPLIVPAMASILGLQIVLYSLTINSGLYAVMLGHLLFVLPYVYFSLSGGVRALDRRYIDIARTLGYGFWRARWRMWWPMLLRPILVALALGMAVSMAQYLPTLLLSGGQFNTPMQLFVQMSAGGNLRQISSIGLSLLLVIAIPFWLSVMIPAWYYRHRRAMLPEE